MTKFLLSKNSFVREKGCKSNDVINMPKVKRQSKNKAKKEAARGQIFKYFNAILLKFLN